MNKIIIHVGLPKTATTFLQTNVFPNIPDFSMLRGWYPHRRLMDQKLGKNLLISDEVISGYLYEGALMEQFHTNLERIKAIYNEPKIIFGIRKQTTYIPSIYRQFLHQKGYQDFHYLFNSANTGLLKQEELLLLPKIEYLTANFKNVFIYSQEAIKNRQEDFLIALADFMEVEQGSIKVSRNAKPQNVGVKSELQVNLLRRLNKLSAHLEGISPYLSLYSKVIKKLKLTPRDFCQNYFKNLSSSTFSLAEDDLNFIDNYYQQDWEAASKFISF